MITITNDNRAEVHKAIKDGIRNAEIRAIKIRKWMDEATRFSRRRKNG